MMGGPRGRVGTGRNSRQDRSRWTGRGRAGGEARSRARRGVASVGERGRGSTAQHREPSHGRCRQGAQRGGDPQAWLGRRGSTPSSLRACWSFVAQGEALAWEGQAGNTLPSCPCEEEPASPHPARLPCPQVEPPRPPSAGCSSPSAQGSGHPARAKPGARRSVALLAARIVPPCFVRPGLACPSGVSPRHPNKVRAHESSAQARLPGEGRLQKEVWLGDSLPALAARSHSGSAPPDAIMESSNTGFFFFPVRVRAG